tara:strand:- start:996 stop:1658 length:663 start_codon:yes stop_codon:yes gene_type:complete
MRNLLITLLVIITVSTTAQTSMDSLIFNEINNLRSNPKSYIPLVIDYVINQKNRINRIKEGKTKVSSTNGTMTKHNGMVKTKTVTGIKLINRNIKAAEELLLILDNIKPLNKLLYSKDMDIITDNHGKYLDSTNTSGHYGPNKETLNDRFNNLNLKIISENVCSVGSFVYKRKNVKPIIITLLVDAGIDNRGHRKNILDPKIKLISVYMSKKTCVQNFAF